MVIMVGKRHKLEHKQTIKHIIEDDRAKKITVRLILAWVFSILFLLSGISNMFTTSFVGGLLLIIAGLVLFPPLDKAMRSNWNFYLSGWLKFFIVVGLLIISSALIFSSGSTTSKIGSQLSQDNTANIPSTSSTKNKLIAHKFGERFILGNFAYIFHGMETKSEIGEYVFDTFLGEKADGVFLIFDVTIENVGKESEYMWSSNIKVVDDEGRSYSEDTTASIYLEDNKFIFEQMQPRLPKRGKIVFDVPKDLRGKIEVSKSSYSNIKEYVSWVQKL
jgi:hypothetical protein